LFVALRRPFAGVRRPFAGYYNPAEGFWLLAEALFAGYKGLLIYTKKPKHLAMFRLF
jgi:hypothetical protein